jgi:hypothetical protein
MRNTPSNQDDVIDSRDIIARIDELEEERAGFAETLADANEDDAIDALEDKETAIDALIEWDKSEEGRELAALKSLADECEGYSDWQHGETLIARDYFVTYIKELISDCYELPKELESGAWPYRHIAIDYEAAAEEAEQDYMSVEFDGAEYLMRA